MIKEHDRIVLTAPLPAGGLLAGDVGTPGKGDIPNCDSIYP